MAVCQRHVIFRAEMPTDYLAGHQPFVEECVFYCLMAEEFLQSKEEPIFIYPKNLFRIEKRVCHEQILFVPLAVVTNRKRRTDMKKVICSEKAPGAIGPYSQAIEANGMVFVSGQLPIDAATGEMPAEIQAQTRQSLENMKHILEAAGLTMRNVVKTTVFLHEMSLFAEMNGVYATYFEGDFPARSAVAVKALPKGALVEIECIAVR